MVENNNTVATEELTIEKMSIASLITYCQTALSQVDDSVEQILSTLTGQEPTPKVNKEIVGVFNNCVDLADKIISLKGKVDSLATYISL